MAMIAIVSLVAQESITIEGTLVDSKCYVGMGETDDDHGQMRACGAACLRMGQPVRVLTLGQRHAARHVSARVCRRMRKVWSSRSD